jgi:hypothetical protein
MVTATGLEYAIAPLAVVALILYSTFPLVVDAIPEAIPVVFISPWVNVAEYTEAHRL